MEIALELDLHESYLSALKKDPLFQAKYEEMELELHERFIEQRADALAILEDTAPSAALVAREAVIMGTVGGRPIKPEKQLDSAWDVLNRTGYKGVDKHLIGTVDLTDVIIEAYKSKKDPEQNDDGDDEPGVKDEADEPPDDVVLLPYPLTLTDAEGA